MIKKNNFSVLDDDDNQLTKYDVDDTKKSKDEDVDYKKVVKKTTIHVPKFFIYEEENTKNDDMVYGNNLYLNSSWTVWKHDVECTTWTEESYDYIYTIDSIGKFWRFFTYFRECDKFKYQYFVMRNKIKPIWEDNENRYGGICSIKIDLYNKYSKLNNGYEMMVILCLLMMNETLIKDSKQINGISYAIKKQSLYIKIWCRNYDVNISNMLPLSLINKLDELLKTDNEINKAKSNFKFDTKRKYINIKFEQIKPDN